MQKTIVLTGGGTAGHVMPNIAILPDLKNKFKNIIYIGSENGIEKKIISKYKEIKYYSIPTAKLIRKITLKNLALPFVLLNSIIKCYKLLKQIKPNVIFSKGGYVAVPVVIAGSLLKIPIVAHESDSSIGLANRIIYKKCNTMLFSFEEAMKGYEKKGIYSGSPIRQEFFQTKSNNINLPNYDKHKKTILVVGGSLGSKALNKAIIESLPELQNYNVINIVGKGNINTTINIKNYVQIEFTDKIYELYSIADLVISRAGSNTIYELLATAKPMILIPLPKDESRGDQIENAKIFENKGYAKVIYQESLTKQNLLQTINEVIKNKEKYIINMKNTKTINGTNMVVKEIEKFVK